MRRRRASWFHLRHPLFFSLLLVLYVLFGLPSAAATPSDDDEDSGVEDRDDEDGYDVWPEERNLLNPEKAEEKAAEEESCPAACLCNDANHSAACDADEDDLTAFLTSAAKLLRSSNRVFINNFRAGGALTPDALPPLSLSELSLTGGVLPAIAGNATFSPFDGGNKLTRLDLSGNSLAAVGSEALSGLPNLRLLRLSDNSLSVVPEIRFPALLSLSLRGNRLTELNARCLAGTPSLRSVDLSSNRIAHVAPTALHGLSALTRLILTDNPLLHLERLDAFGAARLRVVDVSRAGLSRIPSTLARSVRDLRVEGNNVGAIRRGDLDPYPLVERLSLDGNRIDVVEEDALGRLEVLTRLRLGGNRLGAIPRSLPTPLKHLHLQDNRMVALRAGDLHGLSKLETLDLSSNEIREVEAGALATTPSLHVLSLKGNQLTAISAGTFSGLKNLITLDLSNNPIKQIEQSTFESLSSLKELRISGAGSAEAEAAELFAPLGSLKTLDLSGSPWLAMALTQGGGEALRPLRGLRNLDLSRCVLHALPPDMPLLLPELRLVTLVGNEWYCNGKDAVAAYGLSQWLREPGETVILDAEEIRCAIPDHLRSAPMALLREDDFGIILSTESTTVPEPTSTANAPTLGDIISTTATALIETSTSKPELGTAKTAFSESTENMDIRVTSTASPSKGTPQGTLTNETSSKNATSASSPVNGATPLPPSTQLTKSNAIKTSPTQPPTSTTAEKKLKPPSTSPNYKSVQFAVTESTSKPTETTTETIVFNKTTASTTTEPPSTTIHSSRKTVTSSALPSPTEKIFTTPASSQVPPSFSSSQPSSTPPSDSSIPGRSMSQALARSGADEPAGAAEVPPPEPAPHAVHAAAPITLGLLGTCALLAAVGALYRRGRGMNGGGMGGGANRGGGSTGAGTSSSASGRRASASIAYRPHRDEVSIATVAGEEEEEEGVGERRKGLPYSRPVALW
ncbi:hypothetical protein J437_LFUL010360 [Ladona fulva]|uniref:Uncharacterized protein n=1 Tax=Ladona fulva TaxID=123851 RepID=A0A8K0KG89_LADFU|nr:hypothetical protein J437_LFUL010360 [Ladona fulva]